MSFNERGLGPGLTSRWSSGVIQRGGEDDVDELELKEPELIVDGNGGDPLGSLKYEGS